MVEIAANDDSGIPMNWIEHGTKEKAGKDVKLASLRPQFDENSHRVYYDLLVRSIDAAEVQNIALTGAYGTGKSSVLEELHKKRTDEIIELSLSSIASQQVHNDGDQDTPESEKSQTNLIQKEIVKQLLYRLPAHRTPRSRFRRTSAPQSNRDWLIAGGIGTSLTLLALVLGLLAPVIEHVVPGPWWRHLLAYLILAGVGTGATWLIRRLMAGGTSMTASVGTALTSVTLSSNADTYFDEYLDEIVYFFQASKTKVVLIEDIDRFKDIKVFDTLRALNVLLNSSSILGRIVFVYAIRDSIFEQIESTNKDSLPYDPARRTLEIANRAKFFDVIIPVVPFVSADNARDLMTRSMKSSKFSIDQALIRIVARHTADMRLIHNIRNEFEIYRSRLVIPDKRVYGITDNLVFAIVVFKNAHLADFEEIRHKNSTLDHLYEAWRQLVHENLETQQEILDRLRNILALDVSADERAQRWGDLFTRFLDVLQSSFHPNNGQTSINISPPFDENTIGRRSTWEAIASGGAITVQGRISSGHPVQLSFNSEILKSILDIDIDPADWGKPITTDVESQIAACEERIRFLRHHTWKDLLSRTEFGLKRGGGSVTFDALIEAKLGSDLAKDMVRKGHITSHFALYTSTYYGTHLGPEALEYVRRCVDPGEPDMLFILDNASVKQLLLEQAAENNDAAEIFDDPSILNVSILNYLLAERPQAAAQVAKNLNTWGDLEAEFVNTYCAHGSLPEDLLAYMAPEWTDIVQYTATQAPLPPEKRLPALDSVLNALLHTTGYSVDEKVRDRFETDFSTLASVVSPSSLLRATIVMDLFKKSRAEISDLSHLNAEALEAAVEHGVYPVTEINLRAVTKGAPISLDRLLKIDERVYDHALNHLSDFLDAFDKSDKTPHTIENTTRFKQIVISSAEKASATDVTQLISKANMQCHLRNLAEVPSTTWRILIEQNRIDSTFANTYAYFKEVGSFNDVLGAFHARNSIISWTEDAVPVAQRKELAAAILNATASIAKSDDRVNLALQLDPGVLPVNEIRAHSGGFAGQLIHQGLIADDAETFTSDLIIDWKTREAAILVSTNFKVFLSPTTMPPSQIPNLLLSSSSLDDIRLAVVQNLADYLGGASQQLAEEIAHALNERDWDLPVSQIQALIESGTTENQIIQFIARKDQIDLKDLRNLLREMKEPYNIIADTGSRPAIVPDDSVHRKILSYLKGTVVSTIKPNPKAPGTLRVNLFKTEK